MRPIAPAHELAAEGLPLRLLTTCRERKPMALCGVARLVSNTLRIRDERFEPVLPTHASMLQMISTKRPDLDFSDNFDEVQAYPEPEQQEGKLAVLKGDKLVQDTSLYDNLVRSKQLRVPVPPQPVGCRCMRLETRRVRMHMHMVGPCMTRVTISVA
jgi:hypothetical protein